jgi:uncharacterized membrane protein
MPLQRYVRCYAVTAAVFLALDAIWLALVGPAYRQALGPLMRDQPLWSVAIAFYLCFVVGLLVFAVYPASAPRYAALRAALFGALTYATLELTNLALITGWPAWLAAADIAWGSFVSAAAAASGHRFR